MTADIELPQMPYVLLNWPHPTNHAAIRDYAISCVTRVTAAKDDEIEELREEVDRLEAESQSLLEACGDALSTLCSSEARAARLAEALRLYMAAGFGNSTDFCKQVEAKRAAQVALDPTAAQEGE